MVLDWQVSFPAPKGDEPRKAYLYLPKSYRQDKEKHYPVLYMFDGHNVFFDSDATYGKCWGLKEYLDETETELIVAAVECNHSPDNDRLREYSPFDFKDPELGNFEGLGEKTMDWFINVFKKYIDKNYRTLPDRENTFVAGSSMGGLISLYAVIAHNDVFGKAGALSPSIWANKKEIPALIKEAELDPDTVIYMDYGSEELANHKGMLRVFRQTCGCLMDRNIYLTSRIVPGGTHCEACWEKQLPFMINTLLYEG